jgi:putative ABC transport system permease protein
MSLRRHIMRGLRVLIKRRVADQDLADEAQHYLEQATEEYIARGFSPEEARRAARLECGNVSSIRDEVREHGWENVIETFVADLRYATRQLRAMPGFTALTVFILALGIGATTAIFSAVNPILFKSLPYPEASRIMTIWGLRRDGSLNEGAFGAFHEISQRTHSFETLAAIRSWLPTITSEDEPERFKGQRVSADYFRVVGVAPSIGRDFRADEDKPNGSNVAVLSDALWRRRFSSNPAIVGTDITLDGNIYSVIGIMPATFENVAAPDAEIWTTLQYDLSQGRAWGHHLRLLGRLRTGASMDQASQELNALWPALLKEHPKELFNEALVVSSLQDHVTAGVRPALLAIMASVVLLLVIASLNVTSLLLARGARRQGEFAVRASLGAGRTRLIRQLLTESLLLAAIGGALGIVIAKTGILTLIALSPPGLPRVASIGMDSSVLAFSIGVTMLVGLALGLCPALQAARHGLQAGLQQDARRVTGGHRPMRSALVVAEVAIAFVLLVGAGLLLRSMERLIRVSPGLRTSHLLTMQVQTSGQRFRQPEATFRFFENALDAARRVPGVTSAAFTNQLPMSGDLDSYGVHMERNPTQRPELDRSAFRYAVTPGYFETAGIPLLRGRLLKESDRAGAPTVALVSESLAKSRFPGRDAIGQRVRIGPSDSGPFYTIVGVVGDVKQMSLMRPEANAIYVTLTQWRFADNVLTLVVRAEGDVASLAPALRRAIWSVDKDQPIVRVATMDELLALSAAERRFVMILVTAFAVVALVLAAAGIYGVLSGGVAERFREIGVRAALGASPQNILGLVVRQGITLTLCGTAIGLIGAVAGSRVFAALLFGVSHLDLATYLGMLVLLVAVSGAACCLPALRAARVDPVRALRAD